MWHILLVIQSKYITGKQEAEMPSWSAFLSPSLSKASKEDISVKYLIFCEVDRGDSEVQAKSKEISWL